MVLKSSKANNDFYFELNIFPRSMLFQRDLTLNMPYLVVRDCLAAIFALSQSSFINKEENLLSKYIL